MKSKSVDLSQELAEDDPDICFHCGLDIPAGTRFSAKVLEEKRKMCCAGCAAVAEAIVDSGQESFYRHRTEYAPRGTVVLPDFLKELEVYDNPEIQKSFVVERSENTREASLLLEGITCAACVWLNEKQIAGLDGVISVQINYATHRVQLIWDEATIRLSDILAAIRSIGYSAHPYDPNQQHKLLQTERKNAIRRIGVAGVLGMQIMMLSVALYFGDWVGIADNYRRLFYWAAFILCGPILIYSARPFFAAAFRDIKNGQTGMDIPVALGLTIAFAASVLTTVRGAGHVYYDSVAMFVFFLSTARFFEFRAREHSADVNERLTRVTPATAHRLSRVDGKTETVAVAELIPCDQVRVFAGEIVPTDGVIVSGVSSVDESLLSGESLPRSCKAGDQVVGGSVNAESPILVRVESVGEETVLSHMLRLMQRAQSEKPAVAISANKIAGWFVSGILTLAVLSGVGWYLAGNERWLEIVISLLVVTCPCALSLATPAALTAATGALASAGILVTRGHALETLSKITDFCFDKTGTLTDGRLNLRKLRNYSSLSDQEVLRLAAALEQDSEHLLGKALRAAAQHQGLDVESIQVKDSRNFPGQGVSADIAGKKYSVGNSDFVASDSNACLSRQELERLGSEGYSVVLLGGEGEILAGFLFGDEIRPDAAELISELHERQISVHLLTGDTASAAQRIAGETGIKQVVFRMHPNEKLRYLKKLQSEDKVVAMIGDGINDSPILAGAQVSIAMGSATQLAKFNADIVLMSNALGTLRDGLRHAVKTVAVIRQNLAWALVYNLIAVPAAIAGYVSPWMAAIGMSLSSLLVVLNSARLRRLQ